jgi:multidrug efflux system membrane fusion protein
MKARTSGLILLAALAAGGAGYRYLSGASSPAAPAAARLVPVSVAQAKIGDLPLRLEIIGRAEAYDTVTLRARVDGQVAAVAYTEGQHVAPGSVLVRLDPADFAARLRQAEANLARDEAQLAKARQDVERYIALKAKGFVSEEKVGEVKTVAAAQESTIKADQAAVDLARLQLDYATVRAPIAGIVGARLLSVGAAVKTNDTPLAVINRIKPLYASFAVPEKYLPRLQAGMRSGPLKVAVTVPGSSAPAVEAQARFLDNAVDATTGTIQMKAVLANEAEALTPGQFLNISIAVDVLRDAVLIPAEAVQQGQDGAFVFVVDGAGLAQPRKISVASIQSGTAAVTQGLQAGETLVTDGHLKLAPGAKVQVKEAAKPEAKSPTAASDPAPRKN